MAPTARSGSATQNSARARLSQISSQVSSSNSSDATMSAFGPDAVPQAPEDPLFGLMAAYRADNSDKKVDLGIGAYRDDNAKPWVLPVVKKVS
jgi:aspartate aminotransferase